MSMRVRPSIIAGQWYPGSSRQLRQTINTYLNGVEHVDLGGQIIGLISPHAGYAYSGQTAAYAYDQVKGRSFDTVVVISPVHRVAMGRFAVTSADAYETPLGQVPLDQDLLDQLTKQVTIQRVGYDGEHAIEIQLPFLQVALENWTLLPIMIGASGFQAGEELGHALAQILRGRNALLVASSDLHHIEDYQQVVRLDQDVVDAVGRFDLAQIVQVLSHPDCSVCGRIPVYAVLQAAQALGADRTHVLYHTTSGDVTGIQTPGQYTVGYMAAAIYQSQP